MAINDCVYYDKGNTIIWQLMTVCTMTKGILLLTVCTMTKGILLFDVLVLV